MGSVVWDPRFEKLGLACLDRNLRQRFFGLVCLVRKPWLGIFGLGRKWSEKQGAGSSKNPYS